MNIAYAESIFFLGLLQPTFENLRILFQLWMYFRSILDDL